MVKKSNKKTSLMTTDTAVLDMVENTLPTAKVGEVVLWSPDHGADPSPALCVSVGSGNNPSRIDVQILRPETMTLILCTGVPHRDDPQNRIIVDEEIGVWRKSPLEERVLRVENEVEDIKLSLAGSPDAIMDLESGRSGM